MRIVFLCEQYPPVLWDGYGSYVHVISGALAKRGHEVHVVCAQGTKVVDEHHDGVHVHRRPLLRIPISRLLGRRAHLITGRDYPRDSLALRVSLAISYALWLRRLDLNPDVVETADGETRALLAVVLRHSMPLVICLHSPTMFNLRLRGPLSVKGRIADRLDRISSDHAEVVTSPSALIAERIREHGWLAGREVEVIPNPFDATSLGGVPSADTAKNVVLAVGRVEWGKGIDVLLDAAAHLQAEGLEIRVVLAGKPAGDIDGEPAGRWLERRADELGIACTFAGHVSQDELAELYGEARVVAVPSRFENFPFAALEGMAAGRPVVTTTTTGVAPFIARWNAGSVVPPEDPAALAEAMARYLRDPVLAARAGDRGRLGVRELRPELIAERRERAYEEAIELFHSGRRRPKR